MLYNLGMEDTNGNIVRGENGRFLPGTRTPKPITKENSHEYQRMRREKTARLLRERIIQAHNRADMEPVTSSPEAFAESGALLYEEIVLNRTAYPRDRQDAWEKLGKYAGVLPADIRQGDTDTATTAATAAAAGAAVATVLERVLRDVLAAGVDIVDGTVTADDGGTGDGEGGGEGE